MDAKGIKPHQVPHTVRLIRTCSVNEPIIPDHCTVLSANAASTRRKVDNNPESPKGARVLRRLMEHVNQSPASTSSGQTIVLRVGSTEPSVADCITTCSLCTTEMGILACANCAEAQTRSMETTYTADRCTESMLTRDRSGI